MQNSLLQNPEKIDIKLHIEMSKLDKLYTIASNLPQ